MNEMNEMYIIKPVISGSLAYLENNYDMVPTIKRVEDVRIDDINEMISQTNTAYTLGTITAMTLIIAGIFVMRN